MIIKKYFKIAVFLLLLSVTIRTLSMAIAHPEGSGTNRLYYVNWFNLPKNSIDVLAIGSSTVYSSIIPDLLYNEYGISAFVMANPGESNSTAFWFLEKALKTQSPKVVLIEVRKAFEVFHEAWTRNIVDNMPLSFDKARYLLSMPNDKTRQDSLVSYFLPIIKWHTRWKNVNSTDLASPEKEIYTTRMLTGYWPSTGDYAGEEGRLIENPDVFAEFDYYEFSQLEKIIQLTQRNGIDIILYATPSFDETRWNIARHNTMARYAKENGIPFFDFAYPDIADAAGIDFENDLSDTVHMNTSGAMHVTAFLAEYMNANYEIPNRKDDKDFTFLQERHNFVTRESNAVAIKAALNLEEYINKLRCDFNKDYTVIFSVKDDATRKITDGIANELLDLGFASDLSYESSYQHSFIGVYQNGKITYEARSESIGNSDTEILDYRGVLPDGVKYYVTSAGYKSGNVSRIIIDGKEYSKNSRGFNIVAYDNLTGRVVDSVCWDTYKDAGITFKR